MSFESLIKREQYNLAIQGQRPVGDIVQVGRHPLFHRPYFPRLSPVACYLCQACNTRRHRVPTHEIRNLRRVVLRMPQHVRPRTHYRHVAAQHVPELRQLIHAARPHPSTQPRHPIISPARLRSVCLRVQAHRAEFVAVKWPPVLARTQLLEEYWPRRFQPD